MQNSIKDSFVTELEEQLQKLKDQLKGEVIY
jgi:hypothetical protein